ncbi:metallophosphoesterase [Pedobacter heparinus]|uniref:metallophosphoesterase family protein n=1 Tax=Pedobacter heparinus TaxID=984 RepID=UPI0029307CB1|nr:metallophosphoesterase [Pedobacter heparinus]
MSSKNSIRKLLSTLFCLFSLSVGAQSFLPAGSIVYPFRASPLIAQTGSQFHILYNNRGERIIDSIVLKGPYSRIKVKIDSVLKGRFEYDSYTHMYTNNKIWVSIPVNSPEDMYDLLVYSAGEVNISRRSVKLVKTFPSKHSFIHISDTHVSRNWVGSAKDGYAEELQLLDKFITVANIIAPDFVIVTGDLIHDYTRFNKDARGWGGDTVKSYTKLPTIEEKFRNYFEGAKGYRGVQHINAPVFSVPGNHDFYGMKETDYPAKAAQWNALCGMRVFGMAFAGTRFLFMDDYLGDPVVDIPDKKPLSGLQGKQLLKFLASHGKGELRIIAQHKQNRADTAFLNQQKVKLIVNGHIHTPHVDTLGNTPTIRMRPGVVCRSGEAHRWELILGLFRIIRIDRDSFTFTEPLRFCSNPIEAYDKIKLNLTLSFNGDNTGKSTSNEAVIANKLPENLPGCRIRFVMKKGHYAVTGGRIRQAFDSGKFSIVDVDTDVNAVTSKKVSIKPGK